MPKLSKAAQQTRARRLSDDMTALPRAAFARVRYREHAETNALSAATDAEWQYIELAEFVEHLPAISTLIQQGKARLFLDASLVHLKTV